MSSNSAQKKPFADAMSRFAEEKAVIQIEMTGRALPCSFVGWASKGIAWVNFEIDSTYTLPHIKAPIFGPEYVRYPMQKGDAGILVPADASIAGVSGQAGGTATLTQPANLSALVFLPIGNTAWQDVDVSAVTVYGPNGVVLRDMGSNSIFTLTPNSITMVSPTTVKATVGGTTLELTPAGWSLSGQAGSMTDGTASTSPKVMHNVWQAFVDWANSHAHTAQGATAVTTAPNTPYSGGSIAP